MRILNNGSYRKRILKIQNLLSRDNSAALTCGSKPMVKSEDQLYRFRNSNLFYLTGTLNQNLGLVILPDKLYVFKWREIDPVWDSEEESLESVASRLGAKIIEKKEINSVFKRLNNLYLSLNRANSFERDFLTELLDSSFSQFVRKVRAIKPIELILTPMRETKDSYELNLIKCACSLTMKIFERFVNCIEPGMSELQLTSVLLSIIYSHECEPSFEPIVAAGGNSTVLHHSPSSRVWRKGEPLLVDFGVRFNEYCSDVTRVVFSGKNQKAIDIYLAVEEVKNTLISLLKPGLTFGDIQSQTKTLLKRKIISLKLSDSKIDEIDELFPHGWGHSIGLDVHDPSFLKLFEDYQLKPNMVVTVEPGLYFKRSLKLGFRCEDTVKISSRSARSLTPEFSGPIII